MTFTPWRGKKAGMIPYVVEPREVPERGYRVYLWWRDRGNWRKELARDEKGQPIYVRTKDGKLIKARVRQAQDIAEAKARDLLNTTGNGVAREMAAPLTILDGKRRAFDKATGRYRKRTQHRNEAERALDFAANVWRRLEPPITTWEQVKRAHLRALWRSRIEQLLRKGETGYRGAVITMQRLLAVAQWLRDEELIPAGACVAPRTWKDQLTADWIDMAEASGTPTPKRPRHTIEQSRAIILKAAEVDPRFELLMGLGAEERLGQVRRAWRSAIDLEKRLFTIPGKGNKRGAKIELTPGQFALVTRVLTEGYLRHLERTSLDYPLFPGAALARTEPGKGKGKRFTGKDPIAVQRHLTSPAVSRPQLMRWFQQAEKLAGITHVTGRGAYGVRRVSTDAATDAGISLGALKEFGGWENIDTPMSIYREKERSRDRTEAKDVRAKVRGEVAE